MDLNGHTKVLLGTVLYSLKHITKHIMRRSHLAVPSEDIATAGVRVATRDSLESAHSFLFIFS